MANENLEKHKEMQDIQIRNRVLNSEEWEAKKDIISTDWETLKQKRHKFIKYFNEYKNMPDDYMEAESKAFSQVKSILDIPKYQVKEFESKYLLSDLGMSSLINPQNQRGQAFLNANNAIRVAREIQATNSLYEYNNNIMGGINNSYMGHILNPYEAQILFETTSLGYQGIMLPIKDAFSSMINIVSSQIDYSEIKDIRNYLIDKNILEIIRMAIIDAYVYGGGIITPIFKVNGYMQYFSDLYPFETYFDSKKRIELETLMCFDRYCVIPNTHNDGLYAMRLYSGLPMNLTTIFDDSDELRSEWYAKFSLDTESRSKFFRPDGFGISIFARANKAIYNYEQQIQFLNYALGQLSIVVFNTKSKNFEDGGSADHTWDSPLGGTQISDIESRLSSMQNSMSVQRGLFLNDIEVSALNRTFSGLDSIINAMKDQASLAFQVKQDVLFGEVKSSLGYKEDSHLTPNIIQMREMFRSAITKTIKWCIFGFYAEKDFCKNVDGGKRTEKWKKEDFFRMLKNIEVGYMDNIKTNESILKESGAMDIMKLVEARLMKMSGAINFLSDIPILNKAYNTEDESYTKWLEEIDNLQSVGIVADSTEQRAITEINKAIISKKDPLSPVKDEKNDVTLKQTEKNEETNYNSNNASLKSLEDLGDVDANGIVQPVSVASRRTKFDPTQRDRKKRSHEG